MNRSTVKTLAAASILALSASVLAACSSSSSSAPKTSSSSAATTGQPLVIVDSVGVVFNRTFNPYVQSSLSVGMNMQDLTYEPLLMFNMMQPTQPPIPWLATGYTWSDGGRTLTLTTRRGVTFSDGKPFSAADVAFTFNLLMKNPALSNTAPNPTPLPTSATATGPDTVVLTFAKPQYANLFLIGSTYVLPQHIWQSISNPASYGDPDPVGTGPYVMSSFSTQKVVFKANPSYWQKNMVHVPEIIFPNYVSNDTSNPALESGQIDYAGNDVSNVASNFLSRSPANHTWTASPPYFADNNVVGLFLNVTKAPLNDAKVRQAISAGINRQQLSVQGETGYEPPATSSGGLILPTDNALLDQSYASDLAAAGSSAKVSQILTGDGYAKVGGKWTRNGQPIKFSIEDPSAFTDYATDAQLIATQLNDLGFEVTFNGVQTTQWFTDYPAGNFDAMIHWGAQGPNPFFYFDNWLDSSLTAPMGKTAAGDWERFSSSQAQAALQRFEGTSDPAVQQQALNTLQGIMSSQAPVIPLLYGAAWYEYNTDKYDGWPTQSNQYMNPVPNAPYIEYTLLHLTPKP
jgi:peptide/nickel transport system substrate-binding protein